MVSRPWHRGFGLPSMRGCCATRRPLLPPSPPLLPLAIPAHRDNPANGRRSEEHTSELQSLMRISYAVFCLKKKKTQRDKPTTNYTKHIDNKHTKHTAQAMIHLYSTHINSHEPMQQLTQ